MFCPNCRAEYVEGVTRCPECDIELVTDIEPDDDIDYSELVTVYSTSSQAELAIAKSLLEDAGIDYFAKNEGVLGLVGGGQIGFNPVIGAIEIIVRPDDADAAREILDEMGKADDSDIFPDEEAK